MSKLYIPLAAATLAVATVSSLGLATDADARGGRGGHGGHFRFHHFHHSPIFRHEEPIYVYRKPRVIRVMPRVVRETPRVIKPVATPAPAVKYADDAGRLFDRSSKTWFDGTIECWKGSKGFVYRGNDWFYGNARWVQTSNGWGVSSGELPAKVDCSGVKSLAGKIKPVAAVSEAPAPIAVKPAAAPKETPTRAAQSSPATPTTTSTPKNDEATATVGDCKRFLPSLGETVSVPCTQ